MYFFEFLKPGAFDIPRGVICSNAYLAPSLSLTNRLADVVNVYRLFELYPFLGPV